MKNLWIFIGGFFSGILFLVLVLFCIGKLSSNDERIVYFDKAGDVLGIDSAKVFQVLGDGTAALATIYPDLTVLLVNDGDEYYYDDQWIEMPKGKCFRQVGIYKYMTKNEFVKTVPVVQILDE